MLSQNSIEENSIEENRVEESRVEKKKGTKKFVPPTLEEIQDYVTEKNLSVDAKQFYDYFTVGNWVDAKGNKVKNWKQKLLTWNKYNNGGTQNKKRSATFMDVLEEMENDEKGNSGNNEHTTDDISEVLCEYDIE